MRVAQDPEGRRLQQIAVPVVYFLEGVPVADEEPLHELFIAHLSLVRVTRWYVHVPKARFVMSSENRRCGTILHGQT